MLLFFKSIEGVCDWMGEIREENDEVMYNNRFELKLCQKGGHGCWWLVHKDGAQIGHGISSLAMATNEVVQGQRYEYQHPDFTVYAIWRDADGGWMVNW